MSKNSQQIRVLVVDDSAFMRNRLSMMLMNNPDLDVVGTAVNGRDAIEQVRRTQPDVMTLDIEMPDMNGLDVLDYLMTEHPLPIIMVSALTEKGADATLRALEYGAIDFIAKPINQAVSELGVFEDLLQNKVREAFYSRHRVSSVGCQSMQREGRQSPVSLGLDGGPPLTSFGKRSEESLPNINFEADHAIEFPAVVIGASTGGPNLLKTILQDLPASFPAALVIVQHMPKYFTKVFAENLHAVAAFPIREAQDGEALQPGVGFVVPGDQHAVITREEDGQPRIRFVVESVEYRYRPSIDCAMTSAAEHFGRALVGLVVTGMGNDGMIGCRKIKEHGGTVLVQDEATSLIYGMPRAVAETGSTDLILPDVQLAMALVHAVDLVCTAKK